MRQRMLVIAAVMATLPGICGAGDLEDLKAAQDRYEAAFKSRDIETLVSSIADGYLEFTIDGDLTANWTGRTKEDRRRYFEDLLGRYDDYQVRLLELQYQVTGSTGVVSGKEWLTRKPKDGVLEYPRWRFTSTWVKADGKWQMAACHRSTFPASAPGARPLPQNEGEARILDAVYQLPRWASVPMADGRLLRVLVEAAGAKQVVELGTSTGFSGLWIANALRRTGGHLTTFELDPSRAETARKQFERAGVSDIVTVVQGDAHQGVRNLHGPLDVVFIDAEKDGYPDYFEKLLPLVRSGGLILAHNVRWPAPSADYLKAVTTNPALETIFLNMDDQGVSVTLKKR